MNSITSGGPATLSETRNPKRPGPAACQTEPEAVVDDTISIYGGLVYTTQRFWVPVQGAMWHKNGGWDCAGAIRLQWAREAP